MYLEQATAWSMGGIRPNHGELHEEHVWPPLIHASLALSMHLRTKHQQIIEGSRDPLVKDLAERYILRGPKECLLHVFEHV